GQHTDGLGKVLHESPFSWGDLSYRPPHVTLLCVMQRTTTTTRAPCAVQPVPWPIGLTDTDMHSCRRALPAAETAWPARVCGPIGHEPEEARPCRTNSGTPTSQRAAQCRGRSPTGNTLWAPTAVAPRPRRRWRRPGSATTPGMPRTTTARAVATGRLRSRAR